MTLLRVNARGDRPEAHMEGGAALERALFAALARPGPVIVMVHGYRYSPGTPGHCPHDLLFAGPSAPGAPRRVSWPRRLGFGSAAQPPGIALAFGWQARGPIRRAYREAAQAGRAMACLVRTIKTIDPSRKVHVLAHSLGARVALQALAHLAPGDLSRLILMAAAEYRAAATGALATASGRAAQVVHVTSRENDLYDCLLEWLVRAEARGDRALGAHVAGANMRSVLIDDSATLCALAGLGFRIAPPARRICHWSPYLRAGVFRLYRALLTDALAPGDLDRILPAAEDRRWSRLLPRPALPALPFASTKAPG
ncbi:MAG: alpha/beta hydrolase [Rhodobacteraceae bacterium]|nr:MAG: alpha/beta hydrolase [Paracoccaceae bacterium]